MRSGFILAEAPPGFPPSYNANTGMPVDHSGDFNLENLHVPLLPTLLFLVLAVLAFAYKRSRPLDGSQRLHRNNSPLPPGQDLRHRGD